MKFVSPQRCGGTGPFLLGDANPRSEANFNAEYFYRGVARAVNMGVAIIHFALLLRYGNVSLHASSLSLLVSIDKW